jgi:hypothetical protein
MFGRGSPVLEYWLRHSAGFELASPGGAHRGVVQEVVIDGLGYPRALIVRGGVLRRARVVNVDAVEAVVPAEGTITLRGSRRSCPRPRLAPATTAPARRGVVALAATAAGALRIVSKTALLVLMLLVSAARWSARRVQTQAPALARRTGRAGASTIAWARPHIRTLTRLAGAAAVTAALIVFTLAHALAVAVAAYARFVAQEWTRRRGGDTAGRMTAERR